MKKYYYVKNDLRLHEIRWFQVKFFASMVGGALLMLALILSVNNFYYDFLGLGNKIQSLENENILLKQRLLSLNSEIKNLESTLNALNNQGNTLRLLVDLPTIDEQTKQAAVGGALEMPEFFSAQSTTLDMLHATTAAVQRLASEINLQKQSYGEIYAKYQYNKELFSALPALKPMVGYYSPSGFGVRMHPVLGIFKTHEGLDIVADVGTPVYAAGNGTVEFAGHSGGGYGNLIVLNHGFGYQSLYAHLSEIKVSNGQYVKRGTLIGKSGRTGLVSGPHLHYEVIYNGVRKNPIDYFLDDLHPAEYQKNLVLNNARP